MIRLRLRSLRLPLDVRLSMRTDERCKSNADDDAETHGGSLDGIHGNSKRKLEKARRSKRRRANTTLGECATTLCSARNAKPFASDVGRNRL